MNSERPKRSANEIVGTNTSPLVPSKNDDGTETSEAKKRKRLTCKGTFKSQPQSSFATKLYKEGRLPMPGIMDFPEKIKLSNAMYGTLCTELQLVRLDTVAGKLVTHMGFVKPGSGGTQYLHPEEAIFLMEAGHFLIRHSDEESSGTISSIQEAYHHILTPDVSLVQYIVYAHLARSGFKVIIDTKNNQEHAELFVPRRIYDAHKPASDFAKTRPPPPQFRVVGVYRWDQPFPSIPTLMKLRDSVTDRNCDGTSWSIPLKIATVAPDGDVSFYSINCASP